MQAVEAHSACRRCGASEFHPDQDEPEVTLRPDSHTTPDTIVDPVVVAIRAACDVATAQLDELERWSVRLADLVHDGALDKQIAVDALHYAAVASGLYKFGTDEIQARIAAGFRRPA